MPLYITVPCNHSLLHHGVPAVCPLSSLPSNFPIPISASPAQDSYLGRPHSKRGAVAACDSHVRTVLTSCCAVRSSTDHGPSPFHGLGVRAPWLKGYVFLQMSTVMYSCRGTTFCVCSAVPAWKQEKHSSGVHREFSNL